MLAAPLADLIRRCAIRFLYPLEEGHYPTGDAHHVHGQRRRRLAETIVDQIRASTAQMAIVQLRVLGGAVARVPVEATAYAHRRRRVLGNVVALYQHPEEAAAHAAWAAGLAAALSQGEPGAYANFVGGEGAAKVREVYPGPTWDRLRAVKARYDPTNLFRLNHNIPPAD